MSIGDQRKILSEKYATTPNIVLSQMLGMTEYKVRYLAYQMGLRKDKSYISDVNRQCGVKSSVSKYWKCYGNK